jgi:hypothetical protein
VKFYDPAGRIRMGKHGLSPGSWISLIAEKSRGTHPIGTR